MERVRKLLVVFTVLLLGITQTFAQEVHATFDAKAELSETELDEVTGEGPLTAIGAGIIVGGGAAVGCAIVGCGSPGQTFVAIVGAGGSAAAGGFLAPTP